MLLFSAPLNSHFLYIPELSSDLSVYGVYQIVGRRLSPVGSQTTKIFSDAVVTSIALNWNHSMLLLGHEGYISQIPIAAPTAITCNSSLLVLEVSDASFATLDTTVGWADNASSTSMVTAMTTFDTTTYFVDSENNRILTTDPNKGTQNVASFACKATAFVSRWSLDGDKLTATCADISSLAVSWDGAVLYFSQDAFTSESGSIAPLLRKVSDDFIITIAQVGTSTTDRLAAGIVPHPLWDPLPLFRTLKGCT
jgi:hypothetical protein